MTLTFDSRQVAVAPFKTSYLTPFMLFEPKASDTCTATALHQLNTFSVLDGTRLGYKKIQIEWSEPVRTNLHVNVFTYLHVQFRKRHSNTQGHFIKYVTKVCWLLQALCCQRARGFRLGCKDVESQEKRQEQNCGLGN